MLDYTRFQIARLTKLSRDDRGVTAIEYGLIAALIAVAIIGGLNQVTTALNATFALIAKSI